MRGIQCLIVFISGILVLSGCEYRATAGIFQLEQGFVTKIDTGPLLPQIDIKNVEVSGAQALMTNNLCASTTGANVIQRPITPSEIAQAIIQILRDAGLSGAAVNDGVTIQMSVASSSITGCAAPSTGQMTASYVIKHLRYGMMEIGPVDGSHTDSSTLWQQRYTKARYGALSDNLANFVAELRDKLIAAEEENQEYPELAEIFGSFRVVIAEAAVRSRPDIDARIKDSYPKGSVVNVIGELPSGWKRLAKEGKPFGWVQETALREEYASSGDDGRKFGNKPSIFVAYPKGGEEVVENSIDLLGYVSSTNRTDRLDVIVNGRPVKLDRLWSRFEVDPAGLRGYPLSWRVPLKPGENKIDINVLDQEGFLVNHAVTVTRIELSEAVVSAAASTGLLKRLENIQTSMRSSNVSADNFMAVLGSWVKDTAKTDYNKGNAMFDQGRFARAAYYYRKSIKTDPIGQAWFNLGISEKALGNGDKASEAFSTACNLEIQQACDVAS